MIAIVKRSDDPDGRSLTIHITKMTGRIYKQGKDSNGKWIDTVGEPDNRYQVYNDVPHKVYPDRESIKRDFILFGAQVNYEPVKFFS